MSVCLSRSVVLVCRGRGGGGSINRKNQPVAGYYPAAGHISTGCRQAVDGQGFRVALNIVVNLAERTAQPELALFDLLGLNLMVNITGRNHAAGTGAVLSSLDGVK